MNHIFGIDGNAYLYKAFYTVRGVAKHKMGEALANRMLAIIGAEATMIKATHVMIAFDGGSNFRYDIYPLYKSSRDGGDTRGTGGPPSKEIYNSLDQVIETLINAGIHVVQLPEYEGDDVLGSLAVRLPKNSVLTIGSGDKDMYQILRRKVRMLYKDTYHKEYKFVYRKNAEAKWGIPHSAFIDYQILLGDGVDDIPKTTPYNTGPVKVANILNTFGSIKGWYQKCGDPNIRAHLTSVQQQISINRKLVTLCTDCYEPDISLMVPKPITDNLPASYRNWLQTLQRQAPIYSTGKERLRRTRI